MTSGITLCSQVTSSLRHRRTSTPASGLESITFLSDSVTANGPGLAAGAGSSPTQRHAGSSTQTESTHTLPAKASPRPVQSLVSSHWTRPESTSNEQEPDSNALPRKTDNFKAWLRVNFDSSGGWRSFSFKELKSTNPSRVIG